MSPVPRSPRPVRPAYFTLAVVPPQRRPPSDRAAGCWGRLDLEVRCITDVHFGSGAPELVSLAGRQALVHGITALPGGPEPKPMIPGSSVKGAVRVVVEAITPSCTRVGGGAACRGAQELCPACELFGAPGWRAKVAFSDLAVQDSTGLVVRELAQRYSHKHAPRLGRRLYGLAPEAPLPSATEHLLCLPAGTRLAGSIRLEGATRPELGLLAIALGLEPDGVPMLRLGAGKNRGMAQVKVRLTGGVIGHGSAALARGALAGMRPDNVATWERHAFEAYTAARSRVAEISKHYQREGG